jgi:hypothetical protein
MDLLDLQSKAASYADPRAGPQNHITIVRSSRCSVKEERSVSGAFPRFLLTSSRRRRNALEAERASLRSIRPLTKSGSRDNRSTRHMPLSTIWLAHPSTLPMGQKAHHGRLLRSRSRASGVSVSKVPCAAAGRGRGRIPNPVALQARDLQAPVQCLSNRRRAGPGEGAGGEARRTFRPESPPGRRVRTTASLRPGFAR